MSNQRFREKDDLEGNKYPLIFFFIGINLLLFHLYYSSTFLLTFSIISLFLAGVVLISKFQDIRKKDHLTISSIFWLSKNYAKMTRKYMLVSIVGVIIAVLIFSQGMLLENSIANQKVDSIDSNYPYLGLKIEQYAYSTAQKYLPQLNSIVVDVFQKYNISPLQNYTISYIKYNQFITSNDHSLESLKIGILNSELINLLSAQQRIPEVTNNSVFVWNSYYYTNYNETTNLEINLQTYNITYLTANFNSVFYGNDFLRDLRDSRVILISEDIFQHLLATTIVEVNIGLLYYVDITYSNDFGNTLHTASAIYSEIATRYNTIANYWLYFDSETILGEIANIDQNVIGLKLFFLMGSIPIIVLGFFFANFSFSLVSKKKKEIIDLLRTKGASNSQLTTILIGEALIIGLFATIIAMLLSSPWISLSLTASGFLEFKNPIIPIFISKEWLLKTPLIGIILSLDINVQSIIALSQHKNKKPTPTIYNKLENISLIIGLIAYLFLKLYLITNQTQLGFFHFISTVVGPLGLVLLLFGIAAVSGRYFTAFIIWLSHQFTKDTPPAIPLAARSFKLHQHSNAKLLTLLILAVMFSTVYIGTPYTIENNLNEVIHYTLGASNTVNLYNPLTVSELNQIANISGVTAVSQVSTLDFTDYRGIRNIHEILFVDPNSYADVAYWQNRYADLSLQNLMQLLNQSANSVLIPQKILDLDQRTVDQYFAINLMRNTYDAKNISTINLQIAGTFTYFPRVMLYGVDRYSFLPIVANRELLNVIPTWNLNSFLYLKLDPAVSYKQIAIEIKKIVPIGNFQNADEVLVDIVGGLNYSILSLIFNNVLIVTLLISMLAFVYYSIGTIQQRTKEFGVYRSLGMVRSQIFWQLLLESLLLLFYSVIIGFISGVITTEILASNFLFKRTAVPPPRINLPLGNIFTYFLLLLLVSISSAVISLRIVSKHAVANILRAE